MAADNVLPMLVVAAVLSTPRAGRTASPTLALSSGWRAEVPEPDGPESAEESDQSDRSNVSERPALTNKTERLKGPGDLEALEVPEVPEGRAMEIVADSEAVASEVLPLPAPFTMGGPPMTLSLEDMDSLTLLRPPAARPARPASSKKNKGSAAIRGAAGGSSSKQGKKQAKKKGRPPGGSSRPTRNKGKQHYEGPPSGPTAGPPSGPASGPPSGPLSGPTSGPPSGPPSGPLSALSSDLAPHLASYADPYHSYMYEPPHPYGFGYGYTGGYEYPRYEDPVMTHEYQQAASYPEEERFRPSMPAGTSSLTPMSTPSYDAYSTYLPQDSYRPPPRRPPTTPSVDLRPSGTGQVHSTVQLAESVSAGEHHSSHDLNWLSGPGGPGGPGGQPPTTGTSLSASEAPAAPAAARKATLKDILAQDCPGAEELGYCDSPPRYPMQQVSEAIQRCSELVDLMYAPMPEDHDPWAGDGEEAACQSVRRSLRPGYVRDSGSGRWLVAVQVKGRVEQRVPVERCSGAGRPCARLADSKCARNLGFRNGARPTRCSQRAGLVPLLTWDPEAPASCPRLRLVRFPSACVCKLV